MDSISSILGIAIAMQQNKSDSSVGMAVINKAHTIQKQQGEAVLQLINTTPAATGSIDVRV